MDNGTRVVITKTPYEDEELAVGKTGTVTSQYGEAGSRTYCVGVTLDNEFAEPAGDWPFYPSELEIIE